MTWGDEANQISRMSDDEIREKTLGIFKLLAATVLADRRRPTEPESTTLAVDPDMLPYVTGEKHWADQWVKKGYRV